MIISMYEQCRKESLSAYMAFFFSMCLKNVHYWCWNPTFMWFLLRYAFVHCCGTSVFLFMLGLMSTSHLTFSSSACAFAVHFLCDLCIAYCNVMRFHCCCRWRNTVGTNDTIYVSFLKETAPCKEKLINKDFPKAQFLFVILPVSQPVAFPGLCPCRYKPEDYALHPERGNGAQVLLLDPLRRSSSSFSMCQWPTTNRHSTVITHEGKGTERYIVY